MVQLVELSVVVGLYYDVVKALLSSGDRDRGFDSREDYIVSIIVFKILYSTALGLNRLSVENYKILLTLALRG